MAYGGCGARWVSASFLAGARHCSTNGGRWSSNEGRRLERRRDPATTRRTASTSLTGSRRRSSLALVTARPASTVGRAARAEGSSDAETPLPPGVRRVGTSPGLGDAPRWRSSLLDQRRSLVEQQGPKARATPRPRNHPAYGTWAPHPVSATLLAGARHCSTNGGRWSSSKGRRLERRRDPATTRRTARGHLTRSRRRSSLALVTARPTAVVVEQRGPKARATPRPRNHPAYGTWAPHPVSATLLAGARHCSTNEGRALDGCPARGRDRTRRCPPTWCSTPCSCDAHDGPAWPGTGMPWAHTCCSHVPRR
ncbi:hypothetical protein JOE61_003031 [Nocardioides salarius]|uniref:Uncharacterized protein n=1 Tax=Nocardioides salarius TaxID=374513 RepID=A0ABS2MDF0_9ACTN|nr:hypothetical protein [Nocardioides salarius]